jgi:hypothetical protein
MTRRLVASETLAPGVKVRETAERETPAFLATSSALTKTLSDTTCPQHPIAFAHDLQSCASFVKQHM